MLIQDGYLLEGTLCKKTLGASGGSLVHIIFMEVNRSEAHRLGMNDMFSPVLMAK